MKPGAFFLAAALNSKEEKWKLSPMYGNKSYSNLHFSPVKLCSCQYRLIQSSVNVVAGEVRDEQSSIPRLDLWPWLGQRPLDGHTGLLRTIPAHVTGSNTILKGLFVCKWRLHLPLSRPEPTPALNSIPVCFETHQKSADTFPCETLSIVASYCDNVSSCLWSFIFIIQVPDNSLEQMMSN